MPSMTSFKTPAQMPDDLSGFKAWLKAKKFSASTVSTYLHLAKILIRAAKTNELSTYIMGLSPSSIRLSRTAWRTLDQWYQDEHGDKIEGISDLGMIKSDPQKEALPKSSITEQLALKEKTESELRLITPIMAICDWLEIIGQTPTKMLHTTWSYPTEWINGPEEIENDDGMKFKNVIVYWRELYQHLYGEPYPHAGALYLPDPQSKEIMTPKALTSILHKRSSAFFTGTFHRHLARVRNTLAARLRLRREATDRGEKVEFLWNSKDPMGIVPLMLSSPLEASLRSSSDLRTSADWPFKPPIVEG